MQGPKPARGLTDSGPGLRPAELKPADRARQLATETKADGGQRANLHSPGGKGVQGHWAVAIQGRSSRPAQENAAGGAEGERGWGRSPWTGQAAEDRRPCSATALRTPPRLPLGRHRDPPSLPAPAVLLEHFPAKDSAQEGYAGS